MGLAEEREASSAKSARSESGALWGLGRSSAVNGEGDGDGGEAESDVAVETDVSHLRTSDGSGVHCSSRA